MVSSPIDATLKLPGSFTNAKATVPKSPSEKAPAAAFSGSPPRNAANVMTSPKKIRKNGIEDMPYHRDGSRFRQSD